MNFSEKREKNKITITVTLPGWKDPKSRVKYRLAQMDAILKENYDLKGYDLSPGAPSYISNVNNNSVGVFVYEKSGSSAKPTPKIKKTKKTIKSEG